MHYAKDTINHLNTKTLRYQTTEKFVTSFKLNFFLRITCDKMCCCGEILPLNIHKRLVNQCSKEHSSLLQCKCI